MDKGGGRPNRTALWDTCGMQEVSEDYAGQVDGSREPFVARCASRGRCSSTGSYSSSRWWWPSFAGSQRHAATASPMVWQVPPQDTPALHGSPRARGGDNLLRPREGSRAPPAGCPESFRPSRAAPYPRRSKGFCAALVRASAPLEEPIAKRPVPS